MGKKRITTETITGTQIEALRAEAHEARDWSLVETCDRALSLAAHFGEADRAACARAINDASAREHG
jgi:hypothetical protein